MKRRAASIVAAGLLLVACGGQQDDLRAYIERINARPGQSLEPMPEVREFETFVYLAGDRRAPFVPLRPEHAASRAADGPRPDDARPRQVLEAFPLDALKMVGLVVVGGQRFALVRDPENIIHRVPVGTYAGQNHGRIIAVENNAVRLIELVPDGFGGWMERPALLPMDDDARG